MGYRPFVFGVFGARSYTGGRELGRIPPPRHLAELRVRAGALAGRHVDEIAQALGVCLEGQPRRTKGRIGALVEQALGASAGCLSEPDFPHLGVELKTVPVDEQGRARESTFVAAIRLSDADQADWETSTVRRKLAHVLWLPIVKPAGRIGTPLFWQPTAQQQAVLRADFDELVGQIGAGAIEALTAHCGRWLQIRPKAANGSVRTRGPLYDGDEIETVPRGFYLRARFTSAILAYPDATPE